MGSFEFISHNSFKGHTNDDRPSYCPPARVLGNLLTEASPDMMRPRLQNMINALLSGDADAVCGAEWGQPSTQGSRSATATATAR